MDTPFVCLYQPKHQRVIFKLFPSTYLYFADLAQTFVLV